MVVVVVLGVVGVVVAVVVVVVVVVLVPASVSFVVDRKVARRRRSSQFIGAGVRGR